jgi:SAM-dependent methyltransferase
MRFCNYCNQDVDHWRPFRIRLADMSPFLQRLETIGSNIERFSCPHCDSIDRERHLRLYLERSGAMERAGRGAVLHIAPEYRFRQFVQSMHPHPYVQGDLFPNPNDPGIQKIDVQCIPFPDETFDMIVCNHVLEHVEDAFAALVEMRRVLKTGGRAICQTPYASRLTKTFADPLLQSEEDRMFFFGQEDHVRLFGLDIEEMIRSAGFRGRLVPHAELLPDIDPETAGVNEHEPFFDFVRA